MPMYNGNYAAPVWVNGVPPAIGPTELRAMSGTIEKSQILSGSGAPTSGTAGSIGQLYVDTSASPPVIWQMTAQDGEDYIWVTERDIEKNLADTYDSSSTYDEGDFCIYGGILYRANTDIDTPEAWDATHWTETRIADAAAAHFARRDNPHEVTAAQAGLGNVENVLQYSPANPSLRRGTVAFEGTWSGAASPYTKTITVTGPTVTATSHVELQFTPSQMEDLMSRGVRSVHVYNNGGVLTATAWGGVPGSMTAQCTVEELGVNAYLRFHSTQGFTIRKYRANKDWDGALYYSTNARTWTEWDGTTTISSGDTNEIFMRGTGNTVITGGSGTDYRWIISGTSVECDGNIEVLLDWPTVKNREHPVMGQRCYYAMFSNCSSLVSAPELPATELSDYCYSYMFHGCRNIVNAPQLPATVLANRCYSYMFFLCTNLVNAPELPATTLNISCYDSMFRDCRSLVNAPELPATDLGMYSYGCYFRMFSGCTSLVSAPALPATELSTSCYDSMFYGCTSLVNAPALPALGLTQDCYGAMFYGCTSLVNAPALPATSMGLGSYYAMFMECTSLVSAPALPATELAQDCYESMFRGCTSLVNAPALPVTDLRFLGCYSSMFYGCTSLVNAPALPATTLSKNCYEDMFYGCTSLATIPELPATTLYAVCYRNMFNGCSNIKLQASQSGDYATPYTIPSGGGGVLGDYSVTDMFANTGGTFTGTPTINTTYYTSNTVVPAT